jgi:AraC-like DNA-binding protein
MELEVAPSLARLAQVCQLTIDRLLDSVEPPNDSALLTQFESVPFATSATEAVAMQLLLLRFVVRLGSTLHRRFHNREGIAPCAFTPRVPPEWTILDREFSAGRWFRQWLSEYREDFERDHATPARRVRRCIEQRFAEHLSADQLARMVAMSRRQLERQFRAENGESLSECQTRLRIAAAIEPLRAGEPAKAVAWNLGWKSRANMYRALQHSSGHTLETIRRMSEVDAERLAGSLRHRSSARIASTATFGV